MRKGKPQPQGFDPLTVALAGVLALASLCSWRVYQAAGSVIDLAVSRDTYATFIVEREDGTKNIQADNERLAEQVNAGRASLMDAQGEAVVMMGVCLAVGCALAVRLWRQGRVGVKTP